MSVIPQPQLHEPKFIQADANASALKAQYVEQILTKSEFRSACLRLSIIDADNVQWTPVGEGNWYFRLTSSTNGAKWEKWYPPQVSKTPTVQPAMTPTTAAVSPSQDQAILDRLGATEKALNKFRTQTEQRL
ncbi:MAG TPA: hypothetical protein VER79_11655, partial [Candidatus Limnocylindrales bacterium]|nr:hypothetical protein [Candidatus Limnocylindrales bacterium]